MLRMPANVLPIAEQAAKALGITQLVPAIYDDLLQPAAREVGQKFVAVAKAVGIALAPLGGRTPRALRARQMRSQ